VQKRLLLFVFSFSHCLCFFLLAAGIAGLHSRWASLALTVLARPAALLCPLAGRDRPEPPRYVHSINNSRRSSSRISQTAFLPHSRQTASPAGFQGPPSPSHRPCEQCPAFLAFARPFAIPVSRAVCRSASFGIVISVSVIF